jgi:hypothetical protein
MKKNIPAGLTILLLFIFSTLGAQSNDILKGFINKNDFALRSVQKHTILSYSDASALAVRSILRLQLISVKYFVSNPALSKQAAYQARIESIKFLQEHSDVPAQTFSLKDKEISFFGKQELLKTTETYLEQKDLRSVSELDVKDPAALNTFVTSIGN